MSRSSDLYSLQLIDSQLDRNQERLREIGEVLSDHTKIRKAEAILKAKTEALEATQKSLRQAEENVKAQRLKIKHADAKLYSGKIRNPKELQDLQDESLALKRYLSVLEDRQLEFMLELDDKKEQFRKAQETHELMVDNYRKISIDLNSEKDKIASSISELNIRKNSLHTQISEDDLKIYLQIRKQRNGVAVSKVEGRACSSCGATLTAALHQAARSPNQITRCDSCGRILFS